MYYTKDYIFDKILSELDKVTIYEKKEQENIYILEYNGKKAKVDIGIFLAKLDKKKTELSDKKVEEFVYYIVENFQAQNMDLQYVDEKIIYNNVYPVLRSSSFNKNNEESLLKEFHTKETDVYYVLDLKKGYKFLSEEFIKEYKIEIIKIKENAYDNLRKLPLKYNTDEVFGNTFYFLNSKDGYDGARLLNKEVLDYFYEKIGGEYYIGLPHQDTLIISDIKNKKGLEVLQKMMVHFFTEGLVPITTITFKYDGQKIESLFIFVE